MVSQRNLIHSSDLSSALLGQTGCIHALFLVGTARCAVRAAYSGATGRANIGYSFRACVLNCGGYDAAFWQNVHLPAAIRQTSLSQKSDAGFPLSQPVLRSSTAEGGRERAGTLASEASASSCVVHLWRIVRPGSPNRLSAAKIISPSLPRSCFSPRAGSSANKAFGRLRRNRSRFENHRGCLFPF
jgi:hypothetical protein